MESKENEKYLDAPKYNQIKNFFTPLSENEINDIKNRDKNFQYYKDLIDVKLITDKKFKDNLPSKFTTADCKYYSVVRYLLFKNGTPRNVFHSKNFSVREEIGPDAEKHHIHENIVPNLGKKNEKYQEEQQPYNLVFCNYMEHVILHALIDINYREYKYGKSILKRVKNKEISFDLNFCDRDANYDGINSVFGNVCKFYCSKENSNNTDNSHDDFIYQLSSKDTFKIIKHLEKRLREYSKS